MNNRKLLIEAIVTGDVKRLKRLIRENSPQIILISAPRNGKYYSLSASKDIPDKEISLAEIEKLKEDHTVICLATAEGEVTGSISHSEEEVIQRMKDAGEWIEKCKD